MSPRSVLFACAFALSLAPASLRAEEPTEADRAIHHGVELRRERRDEEALAEFRRAFALDQSPRARAQIALAEQALGRWVAAEDDLRAALAATDDAWIARNRAELEAALAKIGEHLGWIEVTTSTPGAVLRVGDGSSVALPAPARRVPVGPVPLTVTAPDRAPIRRSVEVRPGAVVHEEIVFADPPASAAPAQAIPPPPVAAEPPRARSTQRTWGWIAVAGAGAFVAGGIVAQVLREGYVATYNDDAQCPPGRKQAVCGDTRDAGDRAMIAAGVGYGVGAALAATGVFLLLTAPKSDVRVEATADAHGFVGGIGGRF